MSDALVALLLWLTGQPSTTPSAPPPTDPQQGPVAQPMLGGIPTQPSVSTGN